MHDVQVWAQKPINCAILRSLCLHKLTWCLYSSQNPKVLCKRPDSIDMRGKHCAKTPLLQCCIGWENHGLAEVHRCPHLFVCALEGEEHVTHVAGDEGHGGEGHAPANSLAPFWEHVVAHGERDHLHCTEQEDSLQQDKQAWNLELDFCEILLTVTFDAKICLHYSLFGFDNMMVSLHSMYRVSKQQILLGLMSALLCVSA